MATAGIKADREPGFFTVSYHPPSYPEKQFPWRCSHDPKFALCHATHIVKSQRGRMHLEIDHLVCLACGAPQASTVGGNILVDLQMLWGKYGWHAKFGARIIRLRNRWSRIATYLFDENGWNGRHESIARMIDPKLTMKFRVEEIDHPAARENNDRIACVAYDPAYVRPASAGEESGL